MDQPLLSDHLTAAPLPSLESPGAEAGFTPPSLKIAAALFLLIEVIDWNLSDLPAVGFLFRAAILLALIGAGTALAGRLHESHKRTEEALNRSKGMLLGALDALAAPTVVLNEYGVIAAVNRSWREFLDAHGANDSSYEVGSNFFQSKFLLSSAQEKEVLALHNGFRRVLAGDRDEFSFEYSAPSVDGVDWFLARVTGTIQGKKKWVAVMHENITAKKKAALEVEMLQSKQREQSRRDPLTGLGNRLQLQDDLEIMEARLERYGHTYSLVLIDIDQLNSYNDRYGHLRGDEVIETVAETIRTLGRKGDTAYRYGGDEFMIILPAQSAEDAATAAERIRKAVELLEMPHMLNLPAGVVTISAGVSAVEHGECKTVEELLEEVDDAMYRAKQSGRNAVNTFRSATLEVPVA